MIISLAHCVEHLQVHGWSTAIVYYKFMNIGSILDLVWSIFLAFELSCSPWLVTPQMPAEWQVEGKQLQCRQNGSDQLYITYFQQSIVVWYTSASKYSDVNGWHPYFLKTINEVSISDGDLAIMVGYTLALQGLLGALTARIKVA